MTTKLTDNPAVKQLAAIFDLEMPNGFRCVVTDWEFVNNQIVIDKIEVYDADNKFVKEADLSKLKDNMHKFSFVFSKKQ